MGEIRIIEKPEEVPFSAIHDVMVAAHEQNFQKGIVTKSTRLSPEELQAKLGDRGRCFVAMDGDRVAGTSSFCVRRFNCWYARGDVAVTMFTAVLPEYKGQHISSLLDDRIEEEVRALGLKRIAFDTPQGNTLMQEIALKRGYRRVGFFSYPSNHYSVEMMKWLDGCPFSGARISLRYFLRKAYIQLRFKPGRIKRFGI